MLSPAAIQRNFDRLHHDKMLKDLVGNGLSLCLPLLVRLSASETAPVVATALGLRRLLELTYGPTPAARAMVSRLLASQQSDGAFGADPLATAAAVAVLGRIVHESQGCPAGPPNHQLVNAYMKGLAALVDAQSPDGTFHYADAGMDPAPATALILFLLSDDPAFRQAVRYADLMTWMEDRADELDPATDDLWQMARLDPVPVAQAVAA